MPATALKSTNTKAYPVYKFRELMASLGSNQEIQDLIASYGFDAPTLYVIKGWRWRNSIPSKWLPLLMHRAMQDGALRDISKLLKAPF
jgi:hypothetical protein